MRLKIEHNQELLSIGKRIRLFSEGKFQEAGQGGKPQRMKRYFKRLIIISKKITYKKHGKSLVILGAKKRGKNFLINLNTNLKGKKV